MLADTGHEDALRVWNMILPLPEPDHYTCRHFDSATNNCTNYERRPSMCRNHGVAYPCKYDGCTLSAWTTEAVRAALVPA